MSSRKTHHKFNKSSKNQHHHKQNQHNPSNFAQKKLTHQSSNENPPPKERTPAEELQTVSVHKPWPDLQLNQSRLFFECTLFLYSVLALFLQYLNLYKTLWWLPKSYWHWSLKYHLINPYLLSCIGLLLGVRVTKCFWDALGERVDYFCNGQQGWQLTCWKIFEYATVKTPLTTIVCTSFMFSFTRIYLEFGGKALTYFFTPPISYILLFHNAFINELTNFLVYIFSPIIFLFKKDEKVQPAGEKTTFTGRLSKLADSALAGPQALVQLDTFVHMCTDFAERTRQEAATLLNDFQLRCRYCIYTGLLTAYFAILMPRSLLPMRTNSGHPQYMLIDDLWVAQLFTIVALTACSLYITYLFPLNYFDQLYRCVFHLGYWEQIQPVLPQPQPTVHQQQGRHGKGSTAHQSVQEIYVDYSQNNKTPYDDGTRVVYNDNYYIARSHPHFRTVAAEPGNQAHLRLYRLAKDPIQLVSYLCMFQAALVAFEFWLLLLTSDWQQIVTLVLLMFANYLLLAKMFKDRVVIGRIYNPSEEDLQMLKQLRDEMEAKKSLHKQLLERRRQQQQQNGVPEKQQHRR